MRAALRRLPPLETALVVLSVAILATFAVLGRARDAKALEALDSYSTFDANGGGYRAWFELLEREGANVDRFVRRPAFLDGTLTTLVYAEPLSFDPRQLQPTALDVQALSTWVRSGGRLLYLGHDDAAARAGVLHLPQSVPARPPLGEATVAPQLHGVRTVSWDAPLRWKARRALERLAGDRAGATIVSYRFGAGEVVAVIDERMFTNANLASGDRARLAYDVAAPALGPVAFDETPHGHLVPEHWWAVVPRPFAVALALATLAILVAFAGAALRLGPPVRARASRDATSAEFVDALAALLERGRAARTALDDAARSALRAVARAAGLPDDAAPEALAARLDGDAARRVRDLVAAMRVRDPNATALVRGVALAQRLRKDARARSRH